MNSMSNTSFKYGTKKTTIKEIIDVDDAIDIEDEFINLWFHHLDENEQDNDCEIDDCEDETSYSIYNNHDQIDFDILLRQLEE